MSKYGDIIQNARKPENQKSGNLESRGVDRPSGKPESQKTRKSERDETPVNLGVKVPKYKRQFWAAQSKMKGKSMTAVIMAALAKEFGEPD